MSQSKPAALNTHPNLTSADDFYEALINLHQGLSDEQSARLNSKLVLILANHVGEQAVIDQAFALAIRGIQDPEPKR